MGHLRHLAVLARCHGQTEDHERILERLVVHVLACEQQRVGDCLESHCLEFAFVAQLGIEHRERHHRVVRAFGE